MSLFEEVEPLPERTPPPEGWHEPTCTFESHSWVLEIEEGRAIVRCADPCDESLFDFGYRWPVCHGDWQPEDFSTPEAIPVTVTYVDDSTPSGPWGPAEYGYWLDVRVKDADSA